MSSSKLKVKILFLASVEDLEGSRASRDFRTSFVKVAAEASKDLVTYLMNSRSFLEEDSKDRVDHQEVAWASNKERISF